MRNPAPFQAPELPGMPDTSSSIDVTDDLTGAEPPLCVDLDGTLVKSDTLVDAVLLLLAPAAPVSVALAAVAAWRSCRLQA